MCSTWNIIVLMWRYPLGPPNISTSLNYVNLGRLSSCCSDRGITHFFLATRNTIKGVGEKEQRTNEQYAWVNSSARRLSCDTLHSLCICRLSLTCSFGEISSNHEECWLILTGLPSLLLDPISCRLVSSLSGFDCQLPSASPVANSSCRFLLPTLSLSLSLSRVPLPTSGHVEDRGLRPLFGFVPKQTKGSSA